MICGEDPFRRRPRKTMGEVATTGGVCLNGGKTGQMAFQTMTDLQKRAFGWLRKGCRSLDGGTAVSFPRIWMSSGECRIRWLQKGYSSDVGGTVVQFLRIWMSSGECRLNPVSRVWQGLGVGAIRHLPRRPLDGGGGRANRGLRDVPVYGPVYGLCRFFPARRSCSAYSSHGSRLSTRGENHMKVNGRVLPPNPAP